MKLTLGKFLVIWSFLIGPAFLIGLVHSPYVYIVSPEMYAVTFLIVGLIYVGIPTWGACHLETKRREQEFDEWLIENERWWRRRKRIFH